MRANAKMRRRSTGRIAVRGRRPGWGLDAIRRAHLRELHVWALELTGVRAAAVLNCLRVRRSSTAFLSCTTGHGYRSECAIGMTTDRTPILCRCSSVPGGSESGDPRRIGTRLKREELERSSCAVVFASITSMTGLRSAHSACRCWGLLLGLLLALGPAVQSLAAAQGPCGRTPASETSPTTVEALLVPATGTQWTCPDQQSVSVIRALPSDRPDGPANSGQGTSLDDEKQLWPASSQRTGAAVPGRPLISPVLAALRPVVLQI
jgi:hypothetical protein